MHVTVLAQSTAQMSGWLQPTSHKIRCLQVRNHEQVAVTRNKYTGSTLLAQLPRADLFKLGGQQVTTGSTVVKVPFKTLPGRSKTVPKVPTPQIWCQPAAYLE